jgi:hypothetical protein
MNLLRVLSVSVILLAAGVAAAEPAAHVALDYRAADKTCPAADHFGDEVSAKLGFVPWDAGAGDVFHVRITRDGAELIGTIEQPSGTSKVLRAGTCPALAEQLASAVAVALDASPAAPAPAPTPERRLRTLDPPPDNHLVDVALRALDGRKLEVSLVTSRAAFAGWTGGHYSTAEGVQYAKICDVPCNAKLPSGSNTLIVRDLTTDTRVAADTSVQVSSTLDLKYVSHEPERRTTNRRAGWGFLIGWVAATAASAYLWEATNSPWAMHFLDPLMGFATGGLAGGLIGMAFSPGRPADEAHVDVHPGLQTAWKF